MLVLVLVHVFNTLQDTATPASHWTVVTGYIRPVTYSTGTLHASYIVCCWLDGVFTGWAH